MSNIFNRAVDWIKGLFRRKAESVNGEAQQPGRAAPWLALFGPNFNHAAKRRPSLLTLGGTPRFAGGGMWYYDRYERRQGYQTVQNMTRRQRYLALAYERRLQDGFEYARRMAGSPAPKRRGWVTV